jgi:hypothetical protein
MPKAAELPYVRLDGPRMAPSTLREILAKKSHSGRGKCQSTPAASALIARAMARAMATTGNEWKGTTNMKPIAKIIGTVVTVLTLVACGGSGSATEETAKSDESALTGATSSGATAVCVSQEDGPCGGFTTNPCTCAQGLACKPNRIPDIPGTCEPTRCCPAGWDMYKCNEENGTTGLNCHNPLLACASSLTCGGGCDLEVSGRCPVCDPIACPAGERWDSSLCKCVSGCATAADCSGPLPTLCKVCSPGSTGSGCAHWACVAGSCQVAYCN